MLQNEAVYTLHYHCMLSPSFSSVELIAKFCLLRLNLNEYANPVLLTRQKYNFGEILKQPN